MRRKQANQDLGGGVARMVLLVARIRGAGGSQISAGRTVRNNTGTTKHSMADADGSPNLRQTTRSTESQIKGGRRALS